MASSMLLRWVITVCTVKSVPSRPLRTHCIDEVNTTMVAMP